MARKRKAKKPRSRRSPAKSSNAKTRRMPSKARDIRHLREFGGLALAAVGVFMAFVIYGGWSGGLIGGGIEEVSRYLLGVLAYLAPVALICAGAFLVFPDLPQGPRAFQVGLALMLVSLFLFASADSFSLLGGDMNHQVFFDPDYVADHGGVIGDGLYRATSILLGGIGSTIVAISLLVAACFLITGASVRAVLLASGKSARRAAVSAHRTTRQLGQTLGEKRSSMSAATAASGDTAAVSDRVPFGVDSRAADSGLSAGERISSGDSGDGRPLDGANSYPDLFEDDEGVETAASLAVVEEPVMEKEITTAVIERDEIKGDADESVQEELFPRGDDLQEEPPEYIPPDPDMLRKSREMTEGSGEGLERTGRVLVETLSSFGIEASLAGTVSGPRVTRFELQLAPGIKVSRVSNLKNDIAYALATTDIRILAPIPGKSAVGVEVPNMRPNMVTLGDIYRDFPEGSGPLMVWLGKDIAGQPVYADLAQMPHLLVAGTTGSGKSGCINCMISSVLLRCTPDEVRMILIDPKRVELNHFQGIPHLLTPVVTVMKEAANVLNNLIDEMESRYSKMQLAKARHLDELNDVRVQRGEKPLPYIMLVVDELADLMMVAPNEVEDAIIRLAQKSRAVGIHLVLATQRPSVDVITGMIKANVPSRIAFAVSSQIDSRVILDTSGAESLLGQGDMLFSPLGSSKLQRVQGAFVSEEEIQLLTDRCKVQREPEFRQDLLEGKVTDGEGQLAADEDDLLPEAMQLVVSTGTASVSFLQRRLRVGYTRAGRLIDMLEKRGVISGYEGSKPRRVLMGEDDIESLIEAKHDDDSEDVAAETDDGPGIDAGTDTDLDEDLAYDDLSGVDQDFPIDELPDDDLDT